MNAHIATKEFAQYAERSRRQLYMIAYFLLAEQQRRHEILRKIHFHARLYRRRELALLWFNIIGQRHSLSSLKNWLDYFKSLCPAPNWRQAIGLDNPYHPINANTGIGADINRTEAVVGTPVPNPSGLPEPISEANAYNTANEGETQKVLVLQGNPTCGTKTLFFDEDGNPQKSSAKQQSLFTPSQFECHDIQSLAAALQALESQPDKFIIHGQPNEPLTGQLINRRKYQGNAKMPPSIRTGAQVHYFAADIDGLPLVNLGYDQKTMITDVTISELVDKITEKYLPNFRGVSYYAQFSQSCGWKLDAKKEVRMHIWWWLDKKIELSVLKTYAKQINQTVGFSLLDTAIYQETQPIYIAAPIFPKGTLDHLPERGKLIELEKASTSFPENQQITKKRATGKKQGRPSQPPGKLDTFDQWRDFFRNLTAGTSLHDNLLTFFLWALKEKIPEGDLEQIKDALGKSPRMQKSPERWAEINNGEWDNLLNWCKERLAEKDEKASFPLPSGYTMKQGALYVETVGKNDTPAWKLVYDGIFRVIASHKDTDTQTYSVEIQLENPHGIQTVIVPQETLVTKNSLAKTFGKLGAVIDESNAGQCMAYITACLQRRHSKNIEKIRNTRRLGFHENTFVLPDKTLGEDDALKYRGSLPAETGKPEIYANTVRTIFNEWGDEAWVFATTLGFALASPFIERFKLVRNPILALTGESGSGKSTLLKFAISAWTAKMDRPFLIQGSQPNTPIGFSQNINGLNGLPCLFDELNLADAVKGNQVRWNNVAMAFANGQARIRGSKTNETEARGGEKITGVLLGSGEALPDCEFEGIYNRQLEINATKYPPLGFDKGSVGKKRAKLLNKAIDYGAGVFGGDFIQFILDNWKAFSDEYKQLESDWEWRFEAHTEAICLVTVVLRFVGRLLNVNTSRAIETMIENFSKLFCSYKNQENHPANRAMEKIRDMIANSTPATRNEGRDLVELDYYKYGNMPFYWVTNEGDYAIPSTNELLERHVGDIRQYFKKWVASGFILPGKNKATQVIRSKIGPNNARCIIISHDFLESSISEPNVTPITPIERASEKLGVTGVTSENTTTQNDPREQGVTPVTPEMTSTEKHNVERITIEASQQDEERQVLMELR